MRTFAADTPVTMSVAFTRNGQPIIPDADSATYKLLGPDGATLTEGALEFKATDVEIPIEISAEFNQISTSFSKRTLVAEARSRGAYLRDVTFYRLVPFTNCSVLPKDVRNYLGANDTELPDDDIDVVKAYLELQTEVGAEALKAALTSGEDAELKANDAVLYRCALDIIPSLQLRIAQREQDGQVSFQRAEVRNFSDLASRTAEKLSSAIAAISSRVEPSYSLLVSTNDADPVTG